MNNLRMFSSLMCAAGLALVGFYAGWHVALGVFLALWGYGVQVRFSK